MFRIYFEGLAIFGGNYSRETLKNRELRGKEKLVFEDEGEE